MGLVQIQLTPLKTQNISYKMFHLPIVNIVDFVGNEAVDVFLFHFYWGDGIQVYRVLVTARIRYEVAEFDFLPRFH